MRINDIFSWICWPLADEWMKRVRAYIMLGLISEEFHVFLQKYTKVFYIRLEYLL